MLLDRNGNRETMGMDRQSSRNKRTSGGDDEGVQLGVAVNGMV